MKPQTSTAAAEFWQTGPVAGIPALLQPVAHTLLQVQREIRELAGPLSATQLWERPAGLASPGFHLQHMTGVLDRLFTYASGAALSAEQLQHLAAEGREIFVQPDALLRAFDLQLGKAFSRLSTTAPETLTEICFVGRQMIPSTRIGLFFHAAEHLMRHTGQFLATVRFLSHN